ncbi:sirohydrochlorin chelatase [Uliginosibacterium sp. H1]|uniref:sirohydrochlorin chelatase n=1 Tax=Uliginosibacterium sp. H1 TaxID=3114757 RepID=UPI002E1922C1|nr:CbiX/SirB N-terminal domain-containing protein [Uliginosibacterium sp. H1]
MASLILFAHGARDPEWARPLERLREAVLARRPDLDVRLAFLEFMAPTLPEAIDAAVAAGAHEVDVAPVFLAQGGHVKRDLPAMLADAAARHPAVKLAVHPSLGEAQSVVEALAQAALAGLGASQDAVAGGR